MNKTKLYYIDASPQATLESQVCAHQRKSEKKILYAVWMLSAIRFKISMVPLAPSISLSPFLHLHVTCTSHNSINSLHSHTFLNHMHAKPIPLPILHSCIVHTQTQTHRYTQIHYQKCFCLHRQFLIAQWNSFLFFSSLTSSNVLLFVLICSIASKAHILV